MEKVGIVYHQDYLKHNTGSHVENSRRLLAIMELLEKDKVKENITFIQPRKATMEEVAEIHPLSYINNVMSFCRRGGGWLDGDTIVSPESGEVAMLAAGGLLSAVDAVMEGRVLNAFVLVRPPGHHAEKEKAMGFCIFNNVAIAARYAQRKYKIEKVLIVDWDVHHGNGTQWSFYDDPSVVYFSIHQSPLYPGTGRIEEVGEAQGRGYNINVPLPPGLGDKAVKLIMTEVFSPIVSQFQPGLILVSAGFDAHWADPLAGLRLTTSGYAQMAQFIQQKAEELCGGKLIGVLEGGYHLKYMPRSVLEVIKKWAGCPTFVESSDEAVIEDDFGLAQKRVKEVKSVLQEFWKF